MHLPQMEVHYYNIFSSCTSSRLWSMSLNNLRLIMTFHVVILYVLPRVSSLGFSGDGAVCTMLV